VEIALLERWAAARGTGARVVRWEEVPPAQQRDRTVQRVGAPRCTAALPRFNGLGACFFVRCAHRARAKGLCWVHRDGVKNGRVKKEP
jgi:hypothetical protein